MRAAELITLCLKASIICLVVALGFGTDRAAAQYLIRRPGLLIRSLIAMNIVMPLFAAVLTTVFDLHPVVKVALVALAISPVPPILPKREIKAGGEGDYAVALLALAAALSVVVIPLMAAALARWFGIAAPISVSAIAGIVATSVLAPLTVGMLVRWWWPGVAMRLARPLSTFGMVLLVVCAVPILLAAWPNVVSLIGNGTLLAIVVFVLVGLAVGHALGGPDNESRSVLALSTATRHPAVAIAIAGAHTEERALAVAAVLLYFIVGALVALPYVIRSAAGASRGPVRT